MTIHDTDTQSVPTVSAPAIASPGDMAARLNAFIGHTQTSLYVHVGKAAYRVRSIQPLDNESLVYTVYEDETVKFLAPWSKPLVLYLVGAQPFTV